MRPRDLDTLATTAYDVLVIGGIHGLAALTKPRRGLRTAPHDAPISAAPPRSTIRRRLTAYSLAAMARYARHSSSAGRSPESRRLLRPLPSRWATYRSATRGRLALRAAFRLTAGRPRSQRWHRPELPPAPRLVSKAATLSSRRARREPDRRRANATTRWSNPSASRSVCARPTAPARRGQPSKRRGRFERVGASPGGGPGHADGPRFSVKASADQRGGRTRRGDGDAGRPARVSLLKAMSS